MDIRISALLGALLTVAGSGHAQTATVNFNGNLLATTCSVVVRGNGGGTGGDGTVIFAPVPATSLASAGARAGRRGWQVIVGSAADPCLAPRVQLGFRNTGNVNPQGRLNNTGTAGNVDVVISNAELGGGAPDIDLSTNANSQVREIPPSTHWVTLSYTSEYYATAAATAGTVTTSVQYDLIYP